jgi:hypothetical protein
MYPLTQADLLEHSFNFGGSDIPSSMQLLSQTNATAAAADVLKVRMALLATLADTPRATRQNSGWSRVSNGNAYATIIVGLLAGVLLGPGL